MVTKTENKMIKEEIIKKLRRLEQEFLNNSEEGYEAKIRSNDFRITVKHPRNCRCIEIHEHYNNKTYSMTNLTVLKNSELIKTILLNQKNIMEQFLETYQKEYDMAKDIFETIGVKF
jgi:hypothetical protein